MNCGDIQIKLTRGKQTNFTRGKSCQPDLRSSNLI
nr:MAG TPA: hypothetical protein [Caudoviricetes sp.]